jgi:hypothetical protein
MYSPCMQIVAIFGIVATAALLGACKPKEGCQGDNDCKGSRICQDHACVDPPVASAPPASTPPASPPLASAPAPTPMPTPIPTPPPPSASAPPAAASSAAAPAPSPKPGALLGYRARLSEVDHKASDGLRLENAGIILQQDRANFHKLGKADAEDQPDRVFASLDERRKLAAARIDAPADVLTQVVQGTPLVFLNVFSAGKGYRVEIELLQSSNTPLVPLRLVRCTDPATDRIVSDDGRGYCAYPCSAGGLCPTKLTCVQRAPLKDDGSRGVTGAYCVP